MPKPNLDMESMAFAKRRGWAGGAGIFPEALVRVG
jgi:hypothetical protein